MEPHDPERPGMELLETNSAPGAFERFTTAALQRRGVRVAGAAVLAVIVGIGIATSLDGDQQPPPASSGDELESEDPPGSTPRDPEYYEPPPWVLSRDVEWQVLGRPRVNVDSPVYVVTFAAVNRSTEARKPNLKAVGRFLGRPGFRFTAACTGYDHHQTGELRPLLTAVRPGDRILVQCRDTMEYSGNRPELDPRTLEIQGLPYDGEGRGPTILYGVPGTNTSEGPGTAQEPPLVRGVARTDG